MTVQTNKNFDKQYSKLAEKVKAKFKQRRNLFLANPFHPALRNHALQQEWQGCRSIDITGDYRAIYYQPSVNLVIFLAIGTHAQLYN